MECGDEPSSCSIYTHWGMSNPAPGVLDFDDYRALQPLFDAAKSAGLWIVLRPGMFIFVRNPRIESLIRHAGPYVSLTIWCTSWPECMAPDQCGNNCGRSRLVGHERGSWHITDGRCGLHSCLDPIYSGVSETGGCKPDNQRWTNHCCANRFVLSLFGSRSLNALADNEYIQQSGTGEYFQLLEKAYRDAFVVVPL
jgi:hypothetical protein